MFNLFKKKNKFKPKRIKYSFTCSDYEITTLVNTLSASIKMLLDAIENENNKSVLTDLINQKYALMEIVARLGYGLYIDEINKRKSVSIEIENIMSNRKLKESITIDSPNSKEIVVDKVVNSGSILWLRT